MTQTKRLTRKELRGPDEFQTLSMRALEWARANPRLLWMAGGGALAAVVLIAVAIGVWQSRAEQAATEFYGASELYKREQWGEALSTFAGIADDYGGTTYGKLSRLYAARAAARAGEGGRAIELYRAYLAAPVGGDAVQQLARLDLAAELQESGDMAAARTEAEQALALEGPAKPLARIRLASLAEAAGERDRAVELYREYLDQTPDGADAEVARARLIALGETPPATAPISPPAVQIR